MVHRYRHPHQSHHSLPFAMPLSSIVLYSKPCMVRTYNYSHHLCKHFFSFFYNIFYSKTIMLKQVFVRGAGAKIGHADDHSFITYPFIPSIWSGGFHCQPVCYCRRQHVIPVAFRLLPEQFPTWHTYHTGFNAVIFCNNFCASNTNCTSEPVAIKIMSALAPCSFDNMYAPFKRPSAPATTLCGQIPGAFAATAPA